MTFNLETVFEPIRYVVFENGARMKLSDLIHYLNEVLDYEIEKTTFYKKSLDDMAILALIKDNWPEYIDHITEETNHYLLYWQSEFKDKISDYIDDLWEKEE